MIDPTMDIKQDELDLILGGISADGKISKEAEKAIMARIEEGRERGLPLLEVKRQLRAKLMPDEGVRVAAAVDELWYKK